MRGEHALSVSGMTAQQGSSPHARGAREQGRMNQGLSGIIPACAGSTTGSSTRRAPSSDHPRMRGEHERIVQLETTDKGSSPHARGARGRREPRGAEGGIIPACAGSTVIYLQIYQMLCGITFSIFD